MSIASRIEQHWRKAMWQRIRSSDRTRRKAAVGALGVLLVVLTGLARPSAAQEGFVVIVNADNPVSSLSQDELSRIFLKKTAAWKNGSRALPADLTASSQVRASFSQKIHGRDTAAIKAYWQKMIFSGRSIPPAELSSATEMAAFVAANRGAIGYLAEGASLGANVKTIRVVP
jgi:ABC-type phosphate transport system substrate-binding protein